MTAPSAKQPRKLNYSKCRFCRKDKKRCEPGDRVWPGQKCDRCQRMDLECSAPSTPLGHSTPSHHIMSQDEVEIPIPSLASSGKPLSKAKAVSSVEEGMHGSKPMSLQSDGPEPSTSSSAGHGSLSSVADQNTGTLIAIQDATVISQECQHPEYVHGQGSQEIRHPVTLHPRPNSSPTTENMNSARGESSNTSLGRSLRPTTEYEDPEEIDGKPLAKKRKLVDPETTFFACPFWKSDPARYSNCFGKRLTSSSRVKQHLVRSHSPDHCPRCFDIFPEPEQLREHMRDGNCALNSGMCPYITPAQQATLSRKSRQTLSEVEKWFSIWDIVFPGRPRPSSPYLDTELSQDLSGFREFLERRGSAVLLETFREAGIMSHDDQERLVREACTRALSSLTDEWLTQQSAVHSSSSGTGEHSLASESERVTAQSRASTLLSSKDTLNTEHQFETELAPVSEPSNDFIGEDDPL